MKRRALGATGIEVAPLAFGANVFGWTVDEPTAFLLLDAFVDHGFNLVDTADVYSRWAPGNSGGESETVIGRWIARSGKRDRLVIATKVGMEMPGVGKGLRAARIRDAVEASLRRLQVERIDLYQAHAEDPETPIDETLEAFDRLVRDGKARSIGASNYSAAALGKALSVSAGRGWARYATLQPRYNLYSRAEFERDLQPLCVREGIGVIPYYGLASGFLTGKYRSEADLAQSARGAAVKQYLDERGMRILDALDEVAREARAKPAQVALAWLMTRPAITAPIASATTLAQLRELMAAADLALDAPSLERLDRASG
ncbi:MAG TPA: aldo/keto reductase [Usitatibacter sp.]|jgi:aryl-alcohol dehydrogenase-like predicted oxidoreductase|nr:aldo/keto reductase [Usitatibacter sp.]